MTDVRSMREQSIVKREHDAEAVAKRVVVTASTGNTVSYEDSSFISGDSPAILNVFSDLGRLGEGGYITNDGTGTFTIEISDDGTTYGGVHTIKNGETMTLDGLFISKIRITHVSDSSYRVLIGHNIKIEKTTLATGDIEIGAVEIKNATDDTRATVTTRGSKGAVGVEILDASGTQITSFGSATITLIDPHGFIGLATVVVGTEIVPATFHNGFVSCGSGGTAVQFPDLSIRWGIVEALSTNTQNVFVGNASVSGANGLELAPGQMTGVAISNFNSLYVSNPTSDPGQVRFIGGL